MRRMSRAAETQNALSCCCHARGLPCPAGSVPFELAAQMLSARLYPTRLTVVADDVVVAGHQRLMVKGKIRCDWRHYILLLERKPGALRNGAPFADVPHRATRSIGHQMVSAKIPMHRGLAGSTSRSRRWIGADSFGRSRRRAHQGAGTATRLPGTIIG